MKTKNKQIDDLFTAWEKAYPPYKGKFTKDGIVEEILYDEKKRHGNATLFIAKDPNDTEQWGGDFRSWWKKPTWGKFSHRLGQYAYGINNDFPPFSEAVNKAYEGLQLIAFMNLKKIGGAGNADKEDVMRCVIDTVDFLKEEISIINPDIIIGGNLYGEVWSLLFGDLEWKNTGCRLRGKSRKIHVAKWGDAKIIGFYHPSNTYSKEGTYNLLESVCKSEVFRKL